MPPARVWRSWKAAQRSEVAAAVMIDDFEAIAGRVCHEYAACGRLKGSMVEEGISRPRYVDDAYGFESHRNLLNGTFRRDCRVG